MKENNFSVGDMVSDINPISFTYLFKGQITIKLSDNVYKVWFFDANKAINCHFSTIELCRRN